jgi:hypothetical protein
MTTSENGWAGIESGSDERLVRIPKIIGRVRGGDVAVILTDLVEQFDTHVEDVDLGADDRVTPTATSARARRCPTTPRAQRSTSTPPVIPSAGAGRSRLLRSLRFAGSSPGTAGSCAGAGTTRVVPTRCTSRSSAPQPFRACGKITRPPPRSLDPLPRVSSTLRQ